VTWLSGEIVAGPDNAGRYSYVLRWLVLYKPGHPDGECGLRIVGQHFFGRPPAGVRRWLDSRPSKGAGSAGGRAGRASPREGGETV